MTTTTEAKTQTYLNYINGEWVASETGKTSVSKNPARKNEVVGAYQLSSSNDFDKAATAARKCPKSMA